MQSLEESRHSPQTSDPLDINQVFLFSKVTMGRDPVMLDEMRQSISGGILLMRKTFEEFSLRFQDQCSKD
jgi:hypothetical protein